ncbi:DNA polymerase III subunit gamma and tau [Nocardia sp. NPDC088792]|uniref:DNA polymerase III subunit gamma and tau n=1 Tax=Nocardia sp. NPDC088792 TaxID=3364332 RepID=UPI003829AC98
MALYRKYRPATFAEVVGQEHVTEPLSTALDTGRISHAYLFSGPRGCGKTSSARILARSLNCVQGPTSTPCGVCSSCVALGPGGSGNLDVIELDAASHGGVDDTRELRDRAFYAPAESRYRVFIVDEAHMVTTAGFNALLKIVEEPPAHLIFVFATTEPDKVLPTIRSRTHHYPFRLLPPATMRGLLGKICDQEGVQVEESVYPLVIRAGGGSPRDSLSVLDQLLAGAGPDGVTYPRAVSLLGVTDVALIDDAVGSLATGDGAALFGTIDRVVEAGHDPRRFATDLLERLRDLILLRAVPDATDRNLVTGPGDVIERMRAQAASLGPATLARHAELLHEGLGDMRGATNPRLLLEVIAARMLLPAATDTETATLQRLETLERRLAGGALPAAPAAPPARPADSAAPRPTDSPAAQPSSPPAPAAGGPSRRRGAEALAALRAEKTGTPTTPTPAAALPAQAPAVAPAASAPVQTPSAPTAQPAAQAPTAPAPATAPAAQSQTASAQDSAAAAMAADVVGSAQTPSAPIAAPPAQAAAPAAERPVQAAVPQPDAVAAPAVRAAAAEPAPAAASAPSAPASTAEDAVSQADSRGGDTAVAAEARDDSVPDAGDTARPAAVRPPEMNAVRVPVAESPGAQPESAAQAATVAAPGQGSEAQPVAELSDPAGQSEVALPISAPDEPVAQEVSGAVDAAAAPAHPAERAAAQRASVEGADEAAAISEPTEAGSQQRVAATAPAAMAFEASGGVDSEAAAAEFEQVDVSGAGEVPESGAAAVSPVGGSEDVLREIEAAWADIRAKVREFGAAVQALLSGASVVRVEGETIVFAHQHAPLAQRLSQPKNLDAVRSAVKAVLGREHDVKWEVGGAPQAAAAPPAGGGGTAPAGAKTAEKKTAPKFSRPSQAKTATAAGPAAATAMGADDWGTTPTAGASTAGAAVIAPAVADSGSAGGVAIVRKSASAGGGVAAPEADPWAGGNGSSDRFAPPEDDIPLPDGPDLPDDPGPTDYSPVGYDGVPPATTPEEEEEMLKESSLPVPPGERRDPDEVALDLLRSELGATPLEG